jgi:hypothetical protein
MIAPPHRDGKSLIQKVPDSKSARFNNTLIQ